MFGFRNDGKKVKNISPFFRIIPNLMVTRDDSQVYFKEDIVLSGMDSYINKKMEEGIKISYMNIISAAIIRLIAERPYLNRFAINGCLYDRNDITISLAIKKSLTDEGQETVLKMPFTGKENLLEVKDKMDSIIKFNKENTSENGVDKLANLLNLVPDFILKFIIRFIAFADKHGFLIKPIVKASPFHTSVFLTNVGSLGIDSIYHHLYNFGTTSMFFAMGKKKKSYVYDDEEIKEEKCITLSFVGDERICDGYYFASSFKLLCKYLKNPELLENNLIEKEK